jgi:SAM-dependent methyltransferase
MLRRINKFLSLFDLRLSRAGQDRNWVPRSLRPKFWEDFKMMRERSHCFVFKNFKHEVGHHPMSFQDFECSFAAKYISEIPDEAKILDIGSYRQFILGIQTGRQIVTLDVREREPVTENETVATGDAREISFPDGHFDCVVSLCSLEHFGLGRYGDVFDPRADEKALREMARVLKPKGLMVVSTTVHRAAPSVAFNAHRIYDLSALVCLRVVNDMVLVEERLFSKRLGRDCDMEQITDSQYEWDVYCGAWRKN